MTKPREVAWATSLLWASFAMGLFTTALDWSYERSLQPVSKLVLDGALTFLVLAFLIWKISQGKNWARIVYLVLFLFGGVFYFTFVRAAIGRSTAVALLTILQSLMQLVALILVFVGPAKDWFKPSTRVKVSA
jgi:hypothetical protein